MVGDGSWAEAKIGEVLSAKDRAAAGAMAPAEGLYLVSVGYPQEIF
jgi:tRNA pseudouridine38-40 synthase